MLSRADNATKLGRQVELTIIHRLRSFFEVTPVRLYVSVVRSLISCLKDSGLRQPPTTETIKQTV